MDPTKDSYIRELEMQNRHLQTRLDEALVLVYQLQGEARSGHLSFMRHCYGDTIMREHYEGKEGCAICQLIKKAKEIGKKP
jgi:hypothetical protein